MFKKKVLARKNLVWHTAFEVMLIAGHHLVCFYDGSVRFTIRECMMTFSLLEEDVQNKIKKAAEVQLLPFKAWSQS